MLVLEGNEDDAYLGVNGHPYLLQIVREEYRFTVHFGHWHEHVELDDEDSVLGICAAILCGRVKIFEQYRSETLTMTWSEDWRDGQWKSLSMSSSYLNPFHSEEWIERPDDDWRTHIRCARFIDVPKFEVAPEVQPHMGETWTDVVPGLRRTPEPWMANMLSESLGEPPEGWTWTSLDFNNFCFPVPIGWRQLPKRNPEQQATEYGPADSSAAITIQTYWSPPEPSEIEEKVVSPYSFERSPMEIVKGYVRHQWQIQFAGPEDKVWVQVTLQIKRKLEDTELPEQLHNHLSSARRLLPNR